MVDLFTTIRVIMETALQILKLEIYLAPQFAITLWEVLLFILLGGLLWRLVNGLFFDE